MSRIANTIAVTLTATVAALVGDGCYIAVDKSSSPDASCPPENPQCGSGSDPGTGPAPGAPSPGDPGYQGPSLSGSGGRTGGGNGGAGGQSSEANAPLPRAPGPAATCPAVTVSRFNELMIVDPAVTRDARADDRSSYRPWSFRQRVEALVPTADAAGPLVDAWLGQWSSLTDVPASTAPGAVHIPIDPRSGARDVLHCPWLRLSPDNGCDATCTNCRSRRVDLARAPFKLLAIVNRTDLAGGRDGDAARAACGSDGGQLRFIYGATDPGTLRALPFTIIFEYAITLRSGETLRDWAALWHQLGTLPTGGDLNARLDMVVTRGLARATLQRVLTNEVAFGQADGLPWEMRQFAPALTDAGTIRLVEIAMSGTPRLTLAQSPELGQWIDDNAAVVLAGENPLPATLLAASAPIPTMDFAWRTMARNASAGATFNHNTCSGCHGGRSDPTDVPFQHVAPPSDQYYGSSLGATATARLSRFLNDPGHDDELGRRERKLAAVLCAACGDGGY